MLRPRPGAGRDPGEVARFGVISAFRVGRRRGDRVPARKSVGDRSGGGGRVALRLRDPSRRTQSRPGWPASLNRRGGTRAGRGGVGPRPQGDGPASSPGLPVSLTRADRAAPSTLGLAAPRPVQTSRGPGQPSPIAVGGPYPHRYRALTRSFTPPWFAVNRSQQPGDEPSPDKLGRVRCVRGDDAMRGIIRRRFLGSVAVVASSAGFELLPLSMKKVLAAAPDPQPLRSLRQVEHVVILMQENRSFDSYFGTLSGVRGFSDPDTPRLPNAVRSSTSPTR